MKSLYYESKLKKKHVLFWGGEGGQGGGGRGEGG